MPPFSSFLLHSHVLISASASAFQVVVRLSSLTCWLPPLLGGCDVDSFAPYDMFCICSAERVLPLSGVHHVSSSDPFSNTTILLLIVGGLQWPQGLAAPAVDVTTGSSRVALMKERMELVVPAFIPEMHAQEVYSVVRPRAATDSDCALHALFSSQQWWPSALSDFCDTYRMSSVRSCCAASSLSALRKGTALLTFSLPSSSSLETVMATRLFSSPWALLTLRPACPICPGPLFSKCSALCVLVKDSSMLTKPHNARYGSCSVFQLSADSCLLSAVVLALKCGSHAISEEFLFLLTAEDGECQAEFRRVLLRTVSQLRQQAMQCEGARSNYLLQRCRAWEQELRGKLVLSEDLIGVIVRHVCPGSRVSHCSRILSLTLAGGVTTCLDTAPALISCFCAGFSRAW